MPRLVEASIGDICKPVGTSCSPLLHGPFPQLEGPQHVPLLVHEGGAEELECVNALLFPHQLPLANQVLHYVQVAWGGTA